MGFGQRYPFYDHNAISKTSASTSATATVAEMVAQQNNGKICYQVKRIIGRKNS